MSAVEPLPHKHRLTVAEYYRMAEVGILPAGSRVELIEGEIIDMTPIGVPHASIVDQLTQIFVQACGRKAVVRVQNPVRLSGDSEPQPDLALLKPRADRYGSGHPGPRDVLLIVEVADTTLTYDRDVKGPLYARHGIPEYWIVDVAGRRIIRHLKPASGRYEYAEPIADAGAVAPDRLSGCAVDLRQLVF